MITEKAVNKRYIHISIDDVLLAFKELTEIHPGSIFDVKMFQFFRKLHQRYGVVLSCYCFYEKDGFSLAESTHSYVHEFEENASWLRFGFHGYSEKIDYDDQEVKCSVKQYEALIHELKLIVGTKSIDLFPRIHGFKASREFISYLMENDCLSLKGLLSADDDRISYSLSEENNMYLKTFGRVRLGSMTFLRTTHRFESIRNCKEIFMNSVSGGCSLHMNGCSTLPKT